MSWSDGKRSDRRSITNVTCPSKGETLPVFDKVDRRILFEIDKNPTIHLNELASLIDAPSAVVENRVASLFETGVIRYSMPVVNLDELGFSVYLVDIKLSSPSRRTMLIEGLKAHPNVGWLVDTTVATVMIAAFFARSPMELKRALGETMDPLGDSFESIQVSTVYEKYVLGQRYLTVAESVTDFVFDSSRIAFTGERAQQLGAEERSVLTTLRELKSLSLHLVADQAGLDPERMNDVIRDLQRRNVIVKFQPVYDVGKLGYRWFLCALSTRWLDKTTRARLLDFLHSMTCVVHINCLLGKWDFNFEIHAMDEHEVTRIVDSLKEEFPSVIIAHSIMQIREEYKFNFLSDCVLASVS